MPQRSKDKMIKLADHRYNTKTDTITLKGDRCPTRKQNVEYVEYIMKVLYIESMVKIMYLLVTHNGPLGNYNGIAAGTAC